jgi:WD40 repeat protein
LLADSGNTTWFPFGEQNETAAISSLVFSPDGKTLAAASENALHSSSAPYTYAIRYWDIGARKKCAQETPGAFCPRCLQYSPDGKLLAAGDHWDLDLIEVGTGQVWAVLEGRKNAYINDLAFSPDGKTVATANHDRTISLWDVPTEKQPPKRKRR